jgi:hypothetical protein
MGLTTEHWLRVSPNEMLTASGLRYGNPESISDILAVVHSRSLCLPFNLFQSAI